MTRRRILLSSSEEDRAEVEMAPLIDIVFILLIFFMVASTLLKESAVDITRPESRAAQPLQASFLTISVDRRGHVHVAGRVIPPDSVSGIRSALAAANQRDVLLRADRDVPTYLLVEVIDSARLAGAERVDVAVEALR